MADNLDFGLALRFLSKLKKNNNKAWFDANKDQYEASMAQFEVLVGRLIEGMSGVEDLEGLAPRDCIMRIYRDVRFSKDKSPYKTGLGAGIAPGGRKSGHMGYHLHLAPGGETMVASGLWDPTPEQLARFRDAIVKDASDFRKILRAAAFKRHFKDLYGEVLKTAPKGYPADHPEIELLRRKQVCVTESFTDDVVASARFPALAVESMKAMKPFVDYLNRLTARVGR
jgi:uncharacterized protein (TIGR02453 family)